MFGSCAEYHLGRIKKQQELEEKKRLEDQKKTENELLDVCKNGDTERVKILTEKINRDCCLKPYVYCSKPDTKKYPDELFSECIYLAVKGDYPEILRILLMVALE